MTKFMFKLKKSINFILEILATILLSVTAILVIYQVFTRYILNSPSDFTQELLGYMLIWLGFVGGAYAFVTRDHMALVFFKEKLSAKNQKKLMIFVDSIILIFALLIMITGGVQLALSVTSVYSPLVGIPRTLVYAMGPISGIFIIIIQVINIWGNITGNEEFLGDEEIQNSEERNTK